ncbi:MAG: bifunctional metallophosphatase/5'-nucleotidase [Ardenticatenaceae bacterium]|nr:bifunctional metallophosphatase/5'-nucleotidase [Ardenticatenaceae bacterium]
MRKWCFMGLGILFWLAACTQPPAPTPVVDSVTAVPPTLTIEPDAANQDSPLTIDDATASSIRQLTILYTNDEHGWMAGMEPDEGAANLVGLWQEREGYAPDDDSFLLLSGGDMWTGPAISTWFAGESMAAVMNEMGYAATAVGNHEFDFGLDGLQAREAQSDFPFLSANIRRRSDGTIPTDLGIQPYTIVTANGIQVGIIGLTTTSTPRTTNPVNVAEFEFIDYETALREIVPEVTAAGAELILVPAHICQGELEALAQKIGDLGVDLLGGGHCNELFAKEINGMVVLEGGYHLTSYARATFQFDTATDTVVDVSYGVETNMGGTADPTIATIVNQWQSLADAELSEVIGYTDEGLARRSPEMQALIVESWLQAMPTAHVAITNMGGMRAALAPGALTLGDVIGVMPFNNVIVDVQLTGQQLLRILAFAIGDAAVGGVHLDGATWRFNDTGEPVDPNETYSLLVNDFMYAGGDGYELLAEFDPLAYNTAVDWRQPVIDWLIAQDSSAERPLDEAIHNLMVVRNP